MPQFEDSNDGWREWSKYVLKTIEGLMGSITDMRKDTENLLLKLTETTVRIDNMVDNSRKIEDLEKDMQPLRPNPKEIETLIKDLKALKTQVQNNTSQIKILNLKSAFIGALIGAVSAGMLSFIFKLVTSLLTGG